MEREDQPDGGAAAQPPSSKSLMEVYLSTLKPLQFGKASLLKFTFWKHMYDKKSALVIHPISYALNKMLWIGFHSIFYVQDQYVVYDWY